MLIKHHAVIRVVVGAVVAIGFFLGVQYFVRSYGRSEPEQMKSLCLTTSDRILILAPHPDDEVLGCGGVIRDAVERHIPVRIVFLTYGDLNEWSFALDRKHPVLKPSAVLAMGEVRHNEAVAAAAMLGLSSTNLVFLGYPDGGAMNLWLNQWGNRKPYRHPLTQVTAVPYASAFHVGAPYQAVEVIHDLETILTDFRPTKIFVSHPADFHPDHKALYLFTSVALSQANLGSTSAVYPYLVHFRNWPQPRGMHLEAPLLPPSLSIVGASWRRYPIGAAVVNLKRKALDQHATQIASSGHYLYSFIRRNELFGDIPPLALVPKYDVVDKAVVANPEWGAEPFTTHRAPIVGIEKREIWLDHGCVSISLTLTRPIAKLTGASFYIFGERPDQPFKQMPKLHVRLGATRYQVLDRDRVLPDDSVTLTRSSRKITVGIPLAVIDFPERVFVGCRTYVGAIPVDTQIWRVIALPPNASQDAVTQNIEPAS